MGAGAFACAVLVIFMVAGSAGRAEPRPESMLGVVPSPEDERAGKAYCRGKGLTDETTEDYDSCYSAHIMWLMVQRCRKLGFNYPSEGFADCMMRETGLPNEP